MRGQESDRGDTRPLPLNRCPAPPRRRCRRCRYLGFGTDVMDRPGLVDQMDSPGLADQVDRLDFVDQMDSPGLADQMDSPGLADQEAALRSTASRRPRLECAANPDRAGPQPADRRKARPK